MVCKSVESNATNSRWFFTIRYAKICKWIVENEITEVRSLLAAARDGEAGEDGHVPPLVARPNAIPPFLQYPTKETLFFIKFLKTMRIFC